MESSGTSPTPDGTTADQNTPADEGTLDTSDTATAEVDPQGPAPARAGEASDALPAGAPDAQPPASTEAPSAESPPQTDSSPDASLSDEQKQRISELDQLKNDGIITDEQYDTAKAKVEAGSALVDSNAAAHEWGNAGSNLPPGPSASELAAANAAQGQGPNAVPEVRPQAAVSNAPGAGVSDASKRLDNNEPHGAEEIAAANSEENKKAAAEASQFPNLEVGQRVTLVGDHSEVGRMAYVTRIIYKDPIAEMLAAVGTPARRFAEVLEYVLVTRDGRSDTLTATPDQVTPLEENQGWGRGQI